MSLKAFYYKVWIYLPIIILIGIIVFIYVIYSTTLLIPLLRNDYTYDQSITNVDDTQPALLLTMRKVAIYANVFVDTLKGGANDNDDGMPAEEEKGWIYFAFIHFFLILMLAGFVRTIFTDPGRVPSDWNNKQDEAARMYRKQAKIDAQIVILKNEPYLHQYIQSHNKVKKTILDNELTTGSTKSRNGKANDAQIQAEEKSPLIESPKTIEKNIQADIEVKLDDSTPGNITGEEVLSERALERHHYDIKREEDTIFEKLKQENNVRTCHHCNKNKPERTHHCRQCNACTLKMDHHCPWVNNCVGFYNYKYFMIMLIYAVLVLWFVVFTYTEVVGDCILNYDVGTSLLFIIVLMYMLALTLATIVTLFCGFHFWLIYKGSTTLEHCEKTKKVRYGGNCWENYVLVFGENYLLWPFPFGVNGQGKGVEFKVIPKNS